MVVVVVDSSQLGGGGLGFVEFEGYNWEWEFGG